MDEKRFKCNCAFKLDNEDNLVAYTLCLKHDSLIEDKLDDQKQIEVEDLLSELESKEPS